MRRALATPLAVTILLWASCPASGAETWADAAPTAITGRGAPVLSPDGRWKISWRRNGADDGHEVWLESASETAAARRIYEFQRHAEVLWSPNSKLIAINDWAVSTEALTSVLRVRPDGAAAEINSFTDRVKKLVAREDLAALDHVYITALKWSRDSMTLLVQVKGHGGRRELERRIAVRVIP
jgi:hypothetical protein